MGKQANSTWGSSSILASGIDVIHAFKHYSSNGLHMGHMKRVGW